MTTGGTSLQLCGPEYALTPMETVSSTYGCRKVQPRPSISTGRPFQDDPPIPELLVRIMPNASCVHKKALISSLTVILLSKVTYPSSYRR